jgi:uncharacterized membrane protein
MNNFNFLKATRIALIVFALTFSTNMNAATPVAFGGGWFSDLIKEIKNIFKGGGHHGGGHHGGGQHGGGDAVPLDGGLGILLLGAAAFGVKKLRENKNEEA